MRVDSKLARLAVVVMLVASSGACDRGGSGGSADTQTSASPTSGSAASSSTVSGGTEPSSDEATTSTVTDNTDDTTTASGSDTTTDTAGSDQSDDTAPAPDEAVPCKFENLDLLPSQPVCYQIPVPQDWSTPDSDDEIVLQVAVFTEPELAGSADPLVYFDGGPGINTLDSLVYSYDSLVEPFVDQRDVIVFDQRGVGTSDPNLGCPEVTDFQFAVDQGKTDEADQDGVDEAVAACRDRLEEAGIDLAVYNTEASAHDADAIRAALGYDSWNVLATSYGTRLAQTYMRLYPESLRSVVLDSVMPIEADPVAEFPAAMQRSLVLVISACAQDPDCSAKYPNFGDDLVTFAADLAGEPLILDVDNIDGDMVQYVVTSDMFGRLLSSALYDKALFAALPQTLADALGQKYGLLSRLIQIDHIQNGLYSAGMFYSVMCHDEVPFSSEGQYNLNLPDKPDTELLLNGANKLNLFDLCDEWPAGKAPLVEDMAVESAIPTLVLAGTFDPVTPPAFAEMVASHLSNSYLFEFPTESHSVTHNSCGRQIAAEFVDDPSREPDDTCIAELPGPQWVLGDAADEVTMIPFEVSSPVALAGVRPEGWTQVAPGVFTRGDSLADPTSLIVQSTGGASEQAVVKQLDEAMDATLEPIDDTRVGSESWTTYSATSDTASDAGQTELLVMLSPVDDVFLVLICPPNQFDQLVKTVAVPFAAGLEVG